ncbi:putative quinol monooxygenase [Pseudovibrio axinellae]|nr:putative quinol monooxygenase [Pseudovibrio axinellae]
MNSHRLEFGGKMYIISGSFKAKDECRADLISMAKKLITPSQAEEGCISYNVYESPLNPGEFLFFERWKTREAITNHFEQPYFKDFSQKFPAMIVGSAQIEIHEVKGTEQV